MPSIVIETLVGEIKMWGGSTAPSGYFDCDGSAISRTTYSALFNVIGTNHGVGDGSTTFNLPDLRSKSPIGAGQGSGLSNRTLGQSGGAESVALSGGEMPSHNHNFHRVFDIGAGDSGVLAANGTGGAFFTSSSGSGQAHENMMPYYVVKFIIKF
jgi:microcystin-dependent protein